MLLFFPYVIIKKYNNVYSWDNKERERMMGRDSKGDTNQEMLPLWLKYPQIPDGSIGWRMGEGEAYALEHSSWYSHLTQEEKERYQAKFPEPVCWSLAEENIKRHGSFWIYNWQQPSVIRYSADMLIKERNAGKKRDIIYFWGHREKQGKLGKEIFSQWYKAEFGENQFTYCCMEQYMMAKKAKLFGDSETEQKIMSATEQGEIKSLGRKVRNFDENVWNEFKSLIVMTGNYYKFLQLAKLRKVLLSTKDAILVEASPYDQIWGIGMSETEAANSDISMWRGSNLLGFALMTVRDEIARVYGGTNNI